MAWDDDFEKEEKHESYGLINFHRRSHGPGRNLLFGSHLTSHRETIVMEVKQGVRHHGLSRDWSYGRRQLIEVEMTPIQFAQLLTSMNFGDGVPCTILRLQGKQMEKVPDTYEPEQAKILKGVKHELDEMVASLDERAEQLDAILSKKHINKGDREEIAALVTGIFTWFRSHAPFAFESFEKSADKVVAAARAQVEEFALSTLVKAGMEKLAERFGLPANFAESRALPPKGDEE